MLRPRAARLHARGRQARTPARPRTAPYACAVSERDQVNTEGLRSWGSPPTDAPAVSVADMLLVTTSEDGTFEEHQTHPPVGSPAAELGPGLRIEQLDDDLVELVMNSCSLRGHFYVEQRQYGCRYAFVLD